MNPLLIGIVLLFSLTFLPTTSYALGPFGETDEIFTFKQDILGLAAIGLATLSSAITLGLFETKMFSVLEQGSDYMSYILAKSFWSIAYILFIFSAWLVYRTTGLEFNLEVTFFAILIGVLVSRICWESQYFGEYGKLKRYGLAMTYLGLSVAGGIAAVVIIAIAMYREWAALTGKAGATMTPDELYNQLQTAYDLLLDHEMDIVVPVGLQIDTPLSSSNNCGWQLANFCYQASINFNSVLGCIGTEEITTGSQRKSEKTC